MKYTSHEIAAGLRLMISSNHLLSLRKITSSSHKEIDTAIQLKKEGFAKDSDSIIEIPADLLNDSSALKAYIQKERSSLGQPDYVVIPKVGSFVIADSAADIGNMLSAKSKSFKDIQFKRMQNKVVIITGGAQGIGAGLVESFFEEGANLVIADLNEKVGEDYVQQLNSRNTPNKALFQKCDVSDFNSVQAIVDVTVLHFGGVDVLISNAGILRAGGLDEMTTESFELMTKVNYTGFFNCAKAVSSIMKIQSEFSDNKHFDIIQINSKSGLRGSNKNFAYAGGKFGGIGLTQSFALELMPYRIKVNSICPGNFFDGPLWSDPNKGLFVQYLNAGKIPGAKSIEDVKNFYEKQVPAGRGCETGDVAKAAFYAIEQEYETGQAIPVTGGQVMLN
jgi:sorbitol-6-phosphate 2-dehydrogenase